jgi:hypothetical protein
MAESVRKTATTVMLALLFAAGTVMALNPTLNHRAHRDNRGYGRTPGLTLSAFSVASVVTSTSVPGNGGDIGSVGPRESEGGGTPRGDWLVRTEPEQRQRPAKCRALCLISSRNRLHQ